jgi:hypothetical protein
VLGDRPAVCAVHEGVDRNRNHVAMVPASADDLPPGLARRAGPGRVKALVHRGPARSDRPPCRGQLDRLATSSDDLGEAMVGPAGEDRTAPTGPRPAEPAPGPADLRAKIPGQRATRAEHHALQHRCRRRCGEPCRRMTARGMSGAIGVPRRFRAAT